MVEIRQNTLDPQSGDPDAASSPRSDHDQLFKKVIMTFLGDLLEIAVPRLAAGLDASAATFLMQETFSAVAEGERAIADLVAEIPSRTAESAPTLAHIEIEGRSREVMKGRMHFYYMHLRLNYRLKVVPIVLNLRGGKTAFARIEVVDEVEGEKINSFHYWVVNLERCDPEGFLASPRLLAWGLAALGRPADGDRTELKFRCLDRIARARLGEKREELLVDMVETYLKLDDDEQRRYTERVAGEAGREVRKMELTWSGKLRAEGRIEAAQDAILLLWKNRHPESAAELESRIRTVSDLGRLYEILERVPDAASIDDLELSNGSPPAAG